VWPDKVKRCKCGKRFLDIKDRGDDDNDDDDKGDDDESPKKASREVKSCAPR